ncbi:S24 family peptidase, partial [Campylobacter jejuni]|nr:S24 family peptidase [Campylobacter jejuni]
GSICVIDRNKTFKNKSICVINTRDGLFIKQVLKQDDGVILLLLKYGAILDKEYLEESNKDFSKEALKFLSSLLK